jgi:hypothetical protein
MKSISKNRTSLILMLVIAISFSAIRFSNPPRNIISYDYYGFYLYLPAFFIYDDIKITNLEVYDSLNNIYNNTPLFSQFSVGPGDNKVIRFFAGMSYMFAPGFFTGHVIAHLTDYPADGFSLPYQRALLVSGMIISLLGLFFSRKILLRFFNDTITSITLVLLFIGSNLVFFYTYGNDAPHLYLFALYTIFIWLTISWLDSPSYRKAALLGLVSGLIIVSRPSEMISLIIPLAWGIYNWKTLRQKILLFVRNYKHLLLALVLGVVVILPQIAYWKIVTGSYFFSPYDDPASTLKLAQPEFINTLFGFRKGWFIYAPMMVFAVAGLVVMFRKYPGYALPLAIFILLNTYLIASFTSLISFGWRAFIQSYAMLVLPLGFFVDFVITRKKPVKWMWLVFLILFTLLHLFKSWQLIIGVIDGSRMTREFYFATFFKLRASPEDQKLLLIDRPRSDVEIFTDEDDYNRRLLNFYDFETPDTKHKTYYDTTHLYEGRYSFRLDSTMHYSPGYAATFDELTKNYYAWIRASAWVYIPDAELMPHMRIVAQFDHKGNIYKYRSAAISDERFNAKAGQWNKLQLDYLTPEVVSKNDRLKVYLWYAGKQPVYVDDFKVELFERK